MSVRVAINGFGRIGRNVLRAIVEAGRNDIEVVAHQRSRPGRDQRASAALRHRARPLSRRGDGQGRHDQRRQRRRSRSRRSRTRRNCRGRSSASTSRSNAPASSPSKEKAAAHLTAGAKRVLVSAPADGADLTVVYGVNHDKLTKDAHRRLQRVLHHQLPRAGRQGAQRRGRHRQGLHDHDPLLHQRPADARSRCTRISIAPAPRR